MKEVRVEDAVGMVLLHDLTKVVPGEYKGPAFKKGHIVAAEDIPALKDMGKYHVFVESLGDGRLHEEEAARRIAAAAAGEAAGERLALSAPSEGKVQLSARIRGLLAVETEALADINGVEEVILATLHRNTVVDPGTVVAGAKVVPLVVEAEKVERVEAICRGKGPVVDVLPFQPLRTGIVVTGTEVFEGRIEDRFAPVLRAKAEALGGVCMPPVFVPDDGARIKSAVESRLAAGAQLVLVGGGMAVDADDLTPAALESAADEVVTYGSPVLPGAMFLLAYKGGVPLVGVPACGIFNSVTVLDLILPRLFAGVRVKRRDITSMAHGGLCLRCKVCRYPVCPFGR